MPPIGVVTRPGLEAIREGLRYARRRRAILGSFVIDLNAMIFGMPTSLFPVLALSVFETGAAGFGLMAAAPAAGAFLGALFSGWVGSVRRTGRAILWAVVAWGLAITRVRPGDGVLPAGARSSWRSRARPTCSRRSSARPSSSSIRRTSSAAGCMSIHALVVTSGPRLGDIEAAVVATLTSPQFAVVSGGVLCVIGVGVVARWFPELARHTIGSPAGKPAERAVG